MSDYDLMSELQKKTALLEMSVKQLRKNGTLYAEKERDYKMLLHTEVLRLRDEGQAVGVIEKIAYGIPSVAKARFERDCAEVVYRANQEAINCYKLEMRLIEAQIQREWSTPISD